MSRPSYFPRYLEKKDWAGAYRTACLGVTDADWRALALAALQVWLVRMSFTPWQHRCDEWKGLTLNPAAPARPPSGAGCNDLPVLHPSEGPATPDSPLTTSLNTACLAPLYLPPCLLAAPAHLAAPPHLTALPGDGG